MLTCPECRGHDVRGGKSPVAIHEGRDIHLYDFYCRYCCTLEDRREDAPDFHEWKRRWLGSAQ